MKTIVTGASSGLSFDNAKSYVSSAGLLAAGFLVAHNGLRLMKMQDNVVANLGLTAAAIAGAMYLENPYLKLALIGVAAYSGVKTLSLATKAVTEAPAGAGGLGFISGMIPEGVKSKIREFLPTFGSVGESDYDSISGEGIGADSINLDEHVGDLGNDEMLGLEESLQGDASNLI